MDESPAGRVIRAEVPLAEMFGYSTDLRSATQEELHTQWNFRNMQKRQLILLKRLSRNNNS